jgi:hypothetical protein
MNLVMKAICASSFHVPIPLWPELPWCGPLRYVVHPYREGHRACITSKLSELFFAAARIGDLQRNWCCALVGVL